MDTNAGRVAFISATTSGPPGGRAGDQRRDVRGRPGPNYIRWTTEWNVDEEMIKGLKLVADKLGWSETMKNRAAKGAEFEDNSDKLSNLLQEIGSSAYQQSAQPDPDQTSSAPNSSAETNSSETQEKVVDGEYKEVDDNPSNDAK